MTEIQWIIFQKTKGFIAQRKLLEFNNSRNKIRKHSSLAKKNSRYLLFISQSLPKTKQTKKEKKEKVVSIFFVLYSLALSLMYTDRNKRSLIRNHSCVQHYTHTVYTLQNTQLDDILIYLLISLILLCNTPWWTALRYLTLNILYVNYHILHFVNFRKSIQFSQLFDSIIDPSKILTL